METSSIDILNVLKTVASIFTPILLFIFGLILTRKIETIKNQSSKEKEWNTKWGETFFETFQELNRLVEEILSLLFSISEMNQKGIANNSEGVEMQKKIPVLLQKLSAMEFKLRTQLVFSPEHGESVHSETTKLFDLIRSVIVNEGGSLDEMHDSLKELNKKAMIAHQEILKIK